MKKSNPAQQDHIDEYKEWQDNQYNPGHFTGGRAPVWLSHPGKPKLLGAVFFFFGLCYATWTTYGIIQLFQKGPSIGEILSVILLSIPSIVLLLAGITLMKKSNP